MKPWEAWLVLDHCISVGRGEFCTPGWNVVWLGAMVVFDVVVVLWLLRRKRGADASRRKWHDV